MTPTAIAFLLLSILLIWGGLAVSTFFLARRPERADYPDGGLGDAPGNEPPILER